MSRGCITRRALIGGEVLPGTISSLVVQARPELSPAVARAIDTIPGAEVDGDPAGRKIVVVLETSDDGELSDRMSRIADLHGVLSVNLVFHHGEAAGVSQPGAA